jgi:hypothetical protein
MLVYLRLLKESFAFAMDALRIISNFALLGVTIGIFNHSCTCGCGLIGPKDL